MAKNKTGFGKRALLAVFATLGLFSTGNSSFIPANNTVKVRGNDAINQQAPTVAPQSKKTNFTGGDNPYKHYRVGERNQRQYRKWVRQNPHKRRSIKCKLK